MFNIIYSESPYFKHEVTTGQRKLKMFSMSYGWLTMTEPDVEPKFPKTLSITQHMVVCVCNEIWRVFEIKHRDNPTF